MKPLNLKISAFGPYAEYTKIDMSKFENGVYLITGDTGSGKTTIFDAISFALYGEASGESRDASMLRSKYAKNDVKTFVELKFSYKDKVYTVSRNPEYERPALRGDKMTKEKADATLVMPDGSVVTKTKEVTAKIREIIGLDKNQFSQIVMIAQGDFLKLLQAGTDERMKILREIFKTYKYTKIQEKLKEYSSNIKALYDETEKNIFRNIQAVICDENSENAILLYEHTKNGIITSADDAISIISKIIEDDERNYKLNEIAIETADKEYVSIHSQYSKAEEITENQKKISSLRTLIKTVTEDITSAEKNYQTVLMRKPEAEKLKAEALIEESTLSEYVTFDRLKQEIEKKEKLKSSKEKEILALSDNLKKIENEIDKTNTFLKSADAVIQKNTQLAVEIGNLTSEIKELNEINSNIEKYDLALSELKNLKNEYEKISVEKDFHAKKHLEMDKAYFDSQAGILALKLEKNSPCPVCGSKEHPLPATLPQNTVTKEELEKEQKILNSLREDAARLSESAAAKAELLENIIAEISKKSKREFSKDKFEEFKKNIISDIETSGKKLKVTESLYEKGIKTFEDRKKAEKTLAENESLLKNTQTDLVALKEENSALLESIKNDKNMISNIRLKYPSLKSAEDEIGKKRKIANEINSEIDCSFEEVQKLKSDLTDANAKLETLKKVTPNGKPDTDKLLQRLNEKAEEKKILLEKSKDFNLRIKTNSQIVSAILTENKKMQKHKQEIGTIISLSDTANGNITGKQKIKLETFAQMSFFESIVEKANIRLMEMSQRQYELIRRKDESNFKNQIGLELDVIDHYNGTTRSVRSLSGGESFKASLSLALGLSDLAQGYSGGIRIDTLFIDEGFGSLDSESLKNALKTLDRLSDGSKTVGIISHIDYLKERIEKQIIVTKKSSGGSKIEILT